ILSVTNNNGSSTAAALHVSTNGNVGITSQNTNAFGIAVNALAVGTAISAQNTGTQPTIYGVSNNVNPSAYAGRFEGGMLAIAKNNASAMAFRAQTFGGGADILVAQNSRRVGINTSLPSRTLDVVGNVQIVDAVGTSTGYVTSITNSMSSGISGGGLEVNNAGDRSIGNTALTVQNLTTKTAGNNSTKTGLEILSTGTWNAAGGMINRGLFVNATGGGDGNYSAILMGGAVGIGTL